MKAGFILLILILCMACHSGMLPCPHAKSVKMKRTSANKPLRQFMESMSAQVNNNDIKNIHYKSSKNTGNSAVENISVEEWDCPRPGSKKYMPKTVKENIRRNFKKINSNSVPKTDSLQTIN